MNRILSTVVGASCAALLYVAPANARQSLDLGVNHVGLSIGNSQRWTGLRINFRDHDVRRVDGLNVTIWKPGDNPEFVMNGIAAGIWPAAGTLNGLGIGIGGVTAQYAINGFALSPIGAVSQGSINGIAIAGLGAVAQQDVAGLLVAGLGAVTQGGIRGVMLAGLGAVAQRDMVGINIAGLGTVSQGSMIGINAAGLGLVAEHDMIGINLGGMAAVAEGDMRWINIGGLATVANGNVEGLSIGGLAVVGTGYVRGISIGGLGVVGTGGYDGIAIGGTAVGTGEAPLRGIALSLGKVDSGRAAGLLIGGYRVRAERIDGVSASAVMLRSHGFGGLGIAPYNEVRGVQRGITIGIFNRADELHGVQIGLLNYAGNNGTLRWLPLINAHF